MVLEPEYSASPSAQAVPTKARDTTVLRTLVEHTIFKGTLRRRPWHIINRMEAVGGELNAFTTKEETTVYTIFPQGNAARAIELDGRPGY